MVEPPVDSMSPRSLLLWAATVVAEAAELEPFSFQMAGAFVLGNCKSVQDALLLFLRLSSVD